MKKIVENFVSLLLFNKNFKNSLLLVLKRNIFFIKVENNVKMT